jgi:HK97 family phage major capsid protein
LQNWEASGALIQTLLRQAYVNGRDAKFLAGSGVGCPLGILKALGAIKIARQTTGTVTYLDLVTMLSRLYAGAGEPIWTINQTLMPTIMTLQDPAGHYIFNAGDATKGVPATLLGLPIKWNGKTPLLGNEGDVMLSKMNYYLTKAGSGPYIALSEHVKFTTNKTVFKIVANIDGQPWVKEPLKLQDKKTTVSPYVILK